MFIVIVKIACLELAWKTRKKHCDGSNETLRWFKLFIAMSQSTYRIIIHLMWFCVLSQKVVWRCGNRCGKDKHPFYIVWRKSTEFPLVWLCVCLLKLLIISVYAWLWQVWH